MTVATPVQALAAAQIAQLDGIIRTLANRPEVAPLIEYMFQNLSSPLGALPAPHTAMSALADAFAENGALVKQADTDAEYGLEVRFRGGCGSLWFHAPVETGPVAHDEVPEVPDDDETASEPETADAEDATEIAVAS